MACARLQFNMCFLLIHIRDSNVTIWMLSFRKKVPLGPFPEQWNIECDMGSNCMGSNQLDTQLKETWGLWAARQMAWLNSVDVHWTNLALPPVTELLFFLRVRLWMEVSRIIGRPKFFIIPSGSWSGGTNWLKLSLSLCSLLLSPSQDAKQDMFNRWYISTFTVNPLNNCSGALENTVGLKCFLSIRMHLFERH